MPSKQIKLSVHAHAYALFLSSHLSQGVLATHLICQVHGSLTLRILDSFRSRSLRNEKGGHVFPARRS